MNQIKPLDLLIIGASAAGVTSAVYAARRKLNFAIISTDIGGEVATSGKIENYTGFPKTDGFELTEQFKKQLEYNEIIVEAGVVVAKVTQQNGSFLTSGNTLKGKKDWSSKAVILASGAHPKKLGLPGEEEFRGKGVTYCTTCDGPLFKGKKVVTIGGGNGVLESALMLAEIGEHTTIINKNSFFKGEQILIDSVTSNPKIEIIYNAMTSEIIGADSVTGVKYRDKTTNQEKTIETQGVFIHIGLIPNSSMVDFVDKNKPGEIIVDMAGKTNVPGLFAAGDVTNTPFKQIAIAAGQGVAAALSAVSYLNNLKK
ncbi:MAG: FAD-dependent oxidoreductase [bacterium]